MSKTVTDPKIDRAISSRHVSTCVGPWGELECFPIWLEAPDPILRLLVLPSEQTVWHFYGMSGSDLIELFREAQLTPAQFSVLSKKELWSIHGKEVRIFPPTELLEGLSPRSREKIYRTLARWSENHYHRSPLFIEMEDFVDELDKIGLNKQIAKTIQQMSWTRRGIRCFSDLPVLLRYASTAKEERALIRLLTRTRSLLLRLKIAGGGVTDEMVNYWTLNKRQPNALSIFEAVFRTSGVDTIDIANLLPAGPRGQLFTFPGINDCLSGRVPDGVWTAVNFFNLTPVPRYRTSPGLGTYLESSYEKLQPDETPVFGDVGVLMQDKNGVPDQAFVFLAGEIGYTKSGPSLYDPWVILPISEIMAHQTRNQKNELHYWRLRIEGEGVI